MTDPSEGWAPQCVVVTLHQPHDTASGQQRTLRARVFASARGATILMEDDRVPVFPDGPHARQLILTFAGDTLCTVSRRPVRFVSVEGASGWSTRVPFSTAALGQAVRAHAVHRRLAALEDAGSAASLHDVLRTLRDAVDDHERRLEVLEAQAAVHRLEERADGLARRLDQIDGAEGRVVRIEDELEDLVGPGGDVVDFEERLSRLERLLAAGASDRSSSKDPPAV